MLRYMSPRFYLIMNTNYYNSRDVCVNVQILLPWNEVHYYPPPDMPNKDVSGRYLLILICQPKLLAFVMIFPYIICMGLSVS
jgi:hypothetical protein